MIRNIIYIFVSAIALLFIGSCNFLTKTKQTVKNTRSSYRRRCLSGGGMRDIIYKAQAADRRPAQIIQKYRFRYSYRYSYRSTGEMV